MDILYLLDRLENLVSSSRRMPLVNQIIVKEADLLDIIDMMRTTIPEEVKQARRINQEKERIIAQAQADAKHIQTRAQEEAERIIQREGLLRTADERAKEILRRAQEQSQTLVRHAEEHTLQLQNEADAYAAETLRNLREHLTNVSTEVERTILSIERGLESLEGQQNEQEELDDVSEGEDEPPLPAQPMPRRASLAADTIGGPTYLF